MDRPALPQVVSYGGGTNSCAMLIGLLEHGERPDAIVFADTGGEKPHTYAHIQEVRAWCAKVGFPDIDVVVGSQPQQIKDGTLEQECIRLGKLPSIAYGFSSCADKWKVQPQNKYVRAKYPNQEVMRLIGFDADEGRRKNKRTPEQLRLMRFPLIEWDWAREECIEAIKRAGLSLPGKSACFFCPSSKKPEVLQLKVDYPDLLRRALEMERRALAGEGQAPKTTGKGLGRMWNWAELIAGAEAADSSAGTPEADCGCYDG